MGTQATRSEAGLAHRYPYLDAPLPIPFAHRGGAAAGDENSMDAFARAVDGGYRYLETDVHATADRVAVVFHDDSLHRMFGRPGKIEDLRWNDVRALRSGGAVVVPTLADAIEAWPQCRWNVDMKADSAVDPTIEVVWKLGARDRVLLASFSDRRIRWVRQVCGPRQATSMAQREVARLRLGSLYGRGLVGFVPGVAAVQVPIRYAGIRVIDERFVRHAHRLGLHVHVWTVDEPDEINALIDLGVDGIMTDRLDVLREVLTARGRWPSEPNCAPEATP
jgi:glycerophosphoryl diester phosphodiesterase